MSKKRKSTATCVDEIDKSMYAAFSTAANSLSQLYTQSINQQKLSFQAGERHGLEKLYRWIFAQKEEGRRVDVIDILNYLQKELDYQGEEPLKTVAAAAPPPPPNRQISLAGGGQGFRTEGGEYVFSHALSSPVRRILENFSRGGYANH